MDIGVVMVLDVVATLGGVVCVTLGSAALCTGGVTVSTLGGVVLPTFVAAAVGDGVSWWRDMMLVSHWMDAICLILSCAIVGMMPLSCLRISCAVSNIVLCSDRAGTWQWVG
jgi:hypothetical protein